MQARLQLARSPRPCGRRAPRTATPGALDGLARRRPAGTAVARAIAGGADDADPAPVALPLFPLPSVLLPSQGGVVRVFEPRFLALFRDQQRAAAAGAARPPQLRFGHVLSPAAAPPALLDGAVGGLPGVGVYCRVTRVEEAAGGGELLVRYEGVRRFKLLAVESEREPYPLAAVNWYDDDLAGLPPQERAAVDSLEREVMALLAEAARLSRRLGGAGGAAGEGKGEGEGRGGGFGGGSELPAELLRYAPPPAAACGTEDYLRAAGVPAGEAIAVWRRHGSVYGAPTARRAAAGDPYQALREAVAKERRQELFSFAAAGCLELGTVERLALLLSRDAAARLAYVAEAARPHIAELAARAAVKGALG
ncbi:hypothetical protein Rsub_01549 [Raphidocelis subcapitata]|uniref:Lon N-terminal domain-containing protein n=1 Tax=Raphidocelis subcapitata TaxID=307507 RepID=A0A2V0NSV1_9CHLO|nr:hypothetical protein Rsub_01549 [Raphidocelis subcapitata]|eukprot:GBF88650.1 hypothetical protein Rsub_01549 [Raphidocelis subcapitata]